MKKNHVSCRLCLSNYPKSKLNNIFTYKLKHTKDSLVDVLFWVFSVEIDVTDPYVKVVCNECLALIEYVLELKRMYQLNQEFLKTEHYDKAFKEADVETVVAIEESSEKDKSIFIASVKDSCQSPSPRIRVTLDTITALCPLTVDINRLETSTEYVHYEQNGNNQFKRRKYVHYNCVDKALDDACNTFSIKKYSNKEILKKDVGDATELNIKSKATKTANLCKSESLLSTLPTVSRSLKNINKSSCANNLMSTSKGKEDQSVSRLSSENNTKYSRIEIHFQTQINKRSEPCVNGLTTVEDANVEPDMVEVDDTIIIEQNDESNMDFSKMFSAKVCLEPVEYLLRNENYTKISEFCFTKENKQLEKLGSDSHYNMPISKTSRQNRTVRKRLFLDYYKNFSSFAVRELIAGKKIRENSLVVNMTNVRKVFVCNFCRKPFSSAAFLNLHHKHIHQSGLGVLNNLKTNNTPLKRRQNSKLPNYISLLYECEDRKSQKIRESIEGSSNSTKDQVNDEAVGLKRKQRECTNANVDKILKSKSKVTKIHHKSLNHNERQDHNYTGQVPENNSSFVWERQNLKTYSAKDFCNNRKVATTNSTGACKKQSESYINSDSTLNKTIQKLSDRLRRFQNLNSDNSLDFTRQ